jgi:phenylacetate-CoA ligase
MIWSQEIETMERADMERLQTSRLQSIVLRTYNRVALFRERCDAAGVRPEEIRSLADLPRLPFLRKADLREQYPWGLFAEPIRNIVRLHASSGTRGKPVVVGYTAADIDVWAEVCARSFCMAGGEPGHLFQNAYGYGLFTGGLGMHYGVERAGAAVVPISGGNTARQMLIIQDFQPHGIACTPSYALNIADYLEEHGVDPRSTSLRYGIFGAEPWSESMRQQLEARLGLDAIDIYGLSELSGPGVACECREGKQGLHINEDYFLPEVVDPDSGEPLPDGDYGELVLTALCKEAFPVVRYRTGDICALYREPCTCGRTLVRMSRVKGRVDDMLVIRGVNVFPSEVEYELLQLSELVPHYQLVVDRDRALDSLEVQVELADSVLRAWGGFDAERPEAEAIRAKAVQLLKSTLGIGCRVTLMPPRSVPRSEGKAVRIVDRRQS